MVRRYLASSSALVLLLSLIADPFAQGQDRFDLPPIRYSESIPNDPVASLQRRLAAGEVRLHRDPKFGYLPSLLKELNISPQSQVLVFSKTSLQIHKISPANPRALYFNDSVYVGYVPGSDILELAANDPQLGAVFYTLDGSGGEHELDRDPSSEVEESKTNTAPGVDDIKLVRDRDNCLSCHATTRTESVPGYLVRSIFPDRSGRPRTGASSFTTDYRSPWKQRWGGWYVTGTHGAMRHMGNTFAIDRSDPQKIDVDGGANLTELPTRVRTGLHLLPSSDLVALLVLEHQTRVHNLITRANYETRQAVALDEAMNQALERPAEYRSESTQRRIASAANALAEALLLIDEPKFEDAVSGTSGFREIFQTMGPVSSNGQSLRQLDLTERLFRYPLSFL
ncbi:MAG: hypothetical protein KGQ51_12705, partial [Planctomycetes bacterium]|nr:hypothetical protein [Planctomycetota bacterium]